MDLLIPPISQTSFPKKNWLGSPPSQKYTNKYYIFWLPKSFYSVNHAIILEKLKFKYKIDGRLLRFFISYLKGRSQRVVIGNENSSDKIVLQIIENKCIKSIVLKLKYKTEQARIQAVFDQYERAFSSEISCLTPIKEILHLDKNIPKLSSLLNELESQNMISGYTSFNVTKSECGILKYEVSDIDRRLNLLHA